MASRDLRATSGAPDGAHSPSTPELSDAEPRSDFICAICQRQIQMRWNSRGAGEILPPLCMYCEGLYTERLSRPAHGAFRDRRMAMQIAALSEALRSEVGRQQWSAKYV